VRLREVWVTASANRPDAVGRAFGIKKWFRLNPVYCKMQVKKLHYNSFYKAFSITSMPAQPPTSDPTDSPGTQPPQEDPFLRSVCPVTNTLDIFGDKWTLLIIRDLMLGKCRYQDLIASPERIASNILADRLKKMEGVGLVVRRAYQHRPLRYEYFLTEKGKDLGPVLEVIVQWGKRHYPGTMIFPKFERDEP
jgi:DNA-binding HxlR family transcriptional regulator